MATRMDTRMAIRVQTAGFNPTLPKPRPQTSYTEYRSFSSPPRIKSARYPSVTVPRSHVSIARFYDWSEDLGECVSISKLYRDLANSKKYDKVKGRSRELSVRSAHHGRLFVRDKAALTKGEREIVEGIYKNRSDVQSEVSYTRGERKFFRGRRDTLLGGTQDPHQPEMLRSETISLLNLPEELLSRVQVNELHTSNDHCVFCDANTREINLKICSHKRDEIPKAPPTTPDKLSVTDEEEINTSRVRIHSKYRTEITQNTQDNSRVKVLKSGDSSANTLKLMRKFDQFKLTRDRKKVFVDVFLPQITAETSRDHTTPSLAIDSRRNGVMHDATGSMRLPGALPSSTLMQKIPIK